MPPILFNLRGDYLVKGDLAEFGHLDFEVGLLG